MNKSYQEILEEFHYFKNDTSLDKEVKEKVDRMQKILISICTYYSLLDNKYIKDVIDDLSNKINSKINEYTDDSNKILYKMKNYSFDFGNKTYDEINHKIIEYKKLLSNLFYIYIDVLSKECNYNFVDTIRLYNDCVNEINSNNNINFLDKNLHEYTNTNIQKDLISKLYSYISNKDFVNNFTNIVRLKNEIDQYAKLISKLKFVKNNRKFIELYVTVKESSSKDLDYIIDKSSICDSLKEKLLDRKQNKILSKRIFDIFYSKTINRLDIEEGYIDKRHIEYIKKEEYLSKLSSYFMKNGFNSEEILNYLWLDNEMIDSKINEYNNKIEQYELLLNSYIDKLSDDDKELYNNHYSTIENIISNICSNPSNMINIYILYLINNIDDIINFNKLNCYDDYKANSIVGKYKQYCNSLIADINLYKSNNYKTKKLENI